MAKQKVTKKMIESKEQADADTQAALSIIKSEQNINEIEARREVWNAAEKHTNEKLAKMENELKVKLEEARATGILQKISYDQAHNELLKYAVLYQIKQKKSYLNGGMTWEDFCSSLGESRRNVDNKLNDLSPLYDAFSEKISVLAGVTFNKIRYLGKSLSEKTENFSVFDDGAIIIDGISIPLTPENKDDIEAAIDAMKDAQKRRAENNEAKLKAKDRVLEEKERVIRRQEKDLIKYKGEVERRGFEPGEENFIQDMENLKTIIVGLELKLDARNMPKNPTPLMTSAYIETLGHAARVFRAYYDSAIDLYGDPEMDDDWEFPNLRANAEQQKDETQSCAQCEYRKAMNNPQKGVRIPGEFGKCIRPEGLCEHKSIKGD